MAQRVQKEGWKWRSNERCWRAHQLKDSVKMSNTAPCTIMAIGRHWLLGRSKPVCSAREHCGRLFVCFTLSDGGGGYVIMD